MSIGDFKAPRGGRRALTRQSPCDLLSESTSSHASRSSSSGNIIYTASRCITTSHPPTTMDTECVQVSPQSMDEPMMVTTPDDEACFVDFQQQKQMDIIGLLPPEIAAYILSFLPHHSQVLTCSCVSKTWQSLSRDSHIWKTLFERRKEEGWRIVKNIEEAWRVLLLNSQKEEEEEEEKEESISIWTQVQSPPPRRLGRAVLVDQDPLQPRSSGYRDVGEVSMDSVDSNVTRGTIDCEYKDLHGIDWFAIYQARFFLTKRWSLLDTTPEPATLDPSWGSNSYLSTASSAVQHWTINEEDEINLESSEDNQRQKTGMLGLNLVEKVLQGHTDSVYCIRFDHDPFKLPIEVERSLQDSARNGPLYDAKTSLGLGSYGKILSGSRDKTIRVWDGDSGICLHTLHGHKGSVLCIEYDDYALFSGSSDQTVIVWDVKVMERGFTPMTVRRIRGHSSAVLDLAINNKWLLSCGKDRTVRVYDRTRDLALIHIYSQHGGPVNAGVINVNPTDGKTRAMTVSGEGGGGAHLWDVDSGTLIRTFVGHEQGLACLRFLGNLVVTGSNDATIRVWNVDSGECLCICKGHADLVRTVAFDSTRKLILSGSYDGAVRLFNLTRELHPNANLATGGSIVKPFMDIDSSSTRRIFDVQMDVTRILYCGEDENICVQDFSRGSPLMRLFT